MASMGQPGAVGHPCREQETGPDFGRTEPSNPPPPVGGSRGAGLEVAEGGGGAPGVDALVGDARAGSGGHRAGRPHRGPPGAPVPTPAWQPVRCGGHKLEDSLDLAGSVSGVPPTESLRVAPESCCRAGGPAGAGWDRAPREEVGPRSPAGGAEPGEAAAGPPAMEAQDSRAEAGGLWVLPAASPWGREGCDADRGRESWLRLLVCSACVLLCTASRGGEPGACCWLRESWEPSCPLAPP